MNRYKLNEKATRYQLWKHRKTNEVIKITHGEQMGWIKIFGKPAEIKSQELLDNYNWYGYE